MKDPRIKLTNDEKLIQNVLGVNNDALNFNMSEGSIENVIEKEKSIKFNNELEDFQKEFEAHQQNLKNLSDKMGVDPEKLEIKPMFTRLLIKPFTQNPFQKIKIENGIVIDSGGFQVNKDFNPVTGKTEDMKPDVVTGCVIEIGPEVKYIKEGDVVFYRDPTCIPVPFFKQGFVSLAENQVIAVVNEDLTTRFKNV